MVAGQGRGWAETGEMGEGEVSDHLGFYSSQYSQDICISFLRSFPLCITRIFVSLFKGFSSLQYTEYFYSFFKGFSSLH